MTAYYLTTFMTVPLDGFLVKELIHAVFPYKFEVLYHAHVVFSSVTLIECFKPATGKILAFITETHKPFPQHVAVICHKGTVFTTWQTARTVFLRKPLVLQVIFHRQITDANTTIHSTRRNKCFFHHFNPRQQYDVKSNCINKIGGNQKRFSTKCRQM